jgi:putative oxidoreductase
MTGLALGLLVLRIGVGLTVAGHGAQKLFGWFGGSGMVGTAAGMTRMRFKPASSGRGSPPSANSGAGCCSRSAC